MLSELYDLAKDKQKREVTVRNKITMGFVRLLLSSLERHGWELPEHDYLPEWSGGSSYQDTIKLWWSRSDLMYEFYYPSRGTGSQTSKGKLKNVSLDFQMRVVLYLLKAWYRLQAEGERRLRDATQRVTQIIRDDDMGKARDKQSRHKGSGKDPEEQKNG